MSAGLRHGHRRTTRSLAGSRRPAARDRDDGARAQALSFSAPEPTAEPVEAHPDPRPLSPVLHAQGVAEPVRFQDGGSGSASSDGAVSASTAADDRTACRQAGRGIPDDNDGGFMTADSGSR